MKKTILLSTVVLALFTTSCGTSQNNNAEAVIITVNATKFKELTTKAGTILDVRTPEEWAEGTIKGATKINYHDDNFEQQVEKLDKKKPVYVYCKSGGRSSSAADILKKKGFKKVYNLDGGITSWREKGFEVVK